ncbi:hypothetical protein [Microbacterium sp. NPDC087592]|uniref:hypothetical protein n=1 Tax=Microbacterium sp. NPDC087592 TaxID=3364193 RepID=UPI0037F602BB
MRLQKGRPRWTVIGLAQRPCTTLTALLFARGLLRTARTGGVVVAVAGFEKLAAGCAKLGFTRGHGPRVYHAKYRAAGRITLRVSPT